jgi:hypothetical protein
MARDEQLRLLTELRGHHHVGLRAALRRIGRSKAYRLAVTGWGPSPASPLSPSSLRTDDG